MTMSRRVSAAAFALLFSLTLSIDAQRRIPRQLPPPDVAISGETQLLWNVVREGSQAMLVAKMNPQDYCALPMAQ